MVATFGYLIKTGVAVVLALIVALFIAIIKEEFFDGNYMDD